MRLGKFILPRWGVLGREARDTAAPSAADKRRAHRVAASMPVLVYGHSAHAPFAEPATTANVSRTGGLVGLSTHVIRFQSARPAGHVQFESIYNYRTILTARDGWRQGSGPHRFPTPGP